MKTIQQIFESSQVVNEGKFDVKYPGIYSNRIVHVGNSNAQIVAIKNVKKFNVEFIQNINFEIFDINNFSKTFSAKAGDEFEIFDVQTGKKIPVMKAFHVEHDRVVLHNITNNSMYIVDFRYVFAHSDIGKCFAFAQNNDSCYKIPDGPVDTPYKFDLVDYTSLNTYFVYDKTIPSYDKWKDVNENRKLNIVAFQTGCGQVFVTTIFADKKVDDIKNLSKLVSLSVYNRIISLGMWSLFSSKQEMRRKVEDSIQSFISKNAKLKFLQMKNTY